jgi:hypothetical protein
VGPGGATPIDGQISHDNRRLLRGGLRTYGQTHSEFRRSGEMASRVLTEQIQQVGDRDLLLEPEVEERNQVGLVLTSTTAVENIETKLLTADDAAPTAVIRGAPNGWTMIT